MDTPIVPFRLNFALGIAEDLKGIPRSKPEGLVRLLGAGYSVIKRLIKNTGSSGQKISISYVARLSFAITEYSVPQY